MVDVQIKGETVGQAVVIKKFRATRRRSWDVPGTFLLLSKFAKFEKHCKPSESHLLSVSRFCGLTEFVICKDFFLYDLAWFALLLPVLLLLYVLLPK